MPINIAVPTTGINIALLTSRVLVTDWLEQSYTTHRIRVRMLNHAEVPNPLTESGGHN